MMGASCSSSRCFCLCLAGWEQAEVVDAAMGALAQLSETQEGLDALLSSEGGTKLFAFVSTTAKSPTTEDALFNARRILAALEATADVK